MYVSIYKMRFGLIAGLFSPTLLALNCGSQGKQPKSYLQKHQHQFPESQSPSLLSGYQNEMKITSSVNLHLQALITLSSSFPVVQMKFLTEVTDKNTEHAHIIKKNKNRCLEGGWWSCCSVVNNLWRSVTQSGTFAVGKMLGWAVWSESRSGWASDPRTDHWRERERGGSGTVRERLIRVISVCPFTLKADRHVADGFSKVAMGTPYSVHPMVFSELWTFFLCFFCFFDLHPELKMDV